MLSFDITDRHIRVVHGVENRGRIKIYDATTIEVSEGLIVNGHIKDIPKVATLINEELKAKKISDKDAVVSISSNLVIFKELHIPKAKGMQLLTMVQNQMQHTMGISDDYSISYTIAGDIEEDGVQAQRILATACPFEIVDCFRKVFGFLGINLKSIAVSCNCISRLILNDMKIRAKMPLLVVQIDPNFVSLNLYENHQLSFSRFASIDPADYENSEDYVYEAVNENIFRMFQFHKSKNNGASIQNVIFYGDTTEYNRLTDALEGMDITASLLQVPSVISGYENIEFSNYANAVGAMFKRQRDVERINLLEVDDSSGRTAAGASFFTAVGITAAVSAALVALVALGININITAMEKEITDIDTYINSQEVLDKIAAVDKAQEQIDKVATYKNQAIKVTTAFDSMPVLKTEVFNDVEGCFSSVKGAYWNELAYDSGIFVITGVTEDIDAPHQVAQNLFDLDKYDNVTYVGFDESQESDDAASALSGLHKFEITIQLRQNIAPEAETQPAETEAAAEEGGAE